MQLRPGRSPENTSGAAARLTQHPASTRRPSSVTDPPIQWQDVARLGRKTSGPAGLGQLQRVRGELQNASRKTIRTSEAMGGCQKDPLQLTRLPAEMRRMHGPPKNVSRGTPRSVARGRKAVCLIEGATRPAAWSVSRETISAEMRATGQAVPRRLKPSPARQPPQTVSRETLPPLCRRGREPVSEAGFQSLRVASGMRLEKGPMFHVKHWQSRPGLQPWRARRPGSRPLECFT